MRVEPMRMPMPRGDMAGLEVPNRTAWFMALSRSFSAWIARRPSVRGCAATGGFVSGAGCVACCTGEVFASG